MLAEEMGLRRSYSTGISPGKSRPEARRQGWGTGTPREQLQQGLGAQAGGCLGGVLVRLVRAVKPNWCPQDNGNEDNLS